MTQIETILRERFGFTEFREGQREVIEQLMAGRSAAAVFPTGGGKSLCYQLPALLLPGLTLVVSPLIALMKDQIDALRQRGIAAQRLDSTLSLAEHREAMQQLRARTLQLIYVAPERFQNERFREAVQHVPISLFAVDEAHCISEWGHNFRPDYLKLAEFARELHAERVLALTATATPPVLADICSGFAIDATCCIRTGFYRENLSITATVTTSEERNQVLLERLRQRPPGPTIVYVTLQRTAEEVAALLAAEGWPAQPYHAGLDDERRATVQNWFFREPRAIVVATIAFGMGIDKSDIRYVYHYNLPKSLENYAQEIGRSGRDGQDAMCEMLVCLEDVNTLENFALGDTPTEASVIHLVKELFAQNEQFDVSMYDLSSRHDIRLLVVRTLLTYLELDGFLAGGTPYYDEYKFKPLESSQAILRRFDGERRAFLKRLFQHARRARLWCYIDLDGTAKSLNVSRDRIIRALDYLAEQGWVELRAEGIRHRYRRLRLPANPLELAADLYQRTLRREQRELQRLQSVLQLVRHDGCHFGALGEYFGDPRRADCGRCSWCVNGRRPVDLPARPAPVIAADVWPDITKVQRQNPQVCTEPRVMTRFLCGLASPRLIRAKLTTHAKFGVLAHIPFQEVLAAVSQRMAWQS